MSCLKMSSYPSHSFNCDPESRVTRICLTLENVDVIQYFFGAAVIFCTTLCFVISICRSARIPIEQDSREPPQMTSLPPPSLSEQANPNRNDSPGGLSSSSSSLPFTGTPWDPSVIEETNQESPPTPAENIMTSEYDDMN